LSEVQYERSKNCIQAIDENFKLIMIRPDHVVLAKENDLKANSIVQVGTVIDFPEGKSDFDVVRGKIAIQNGVGEIDFVCNYEA
jgi:deoxyribose-phosphate aldolase